MKDSDIDWLKKIPEGWEVTTLGHLFSIGMGETILTPNLSADGIPVYSATETGRLFGYVKTSNLQLGKGDFVIPARGNSIGSSKLISDDVATSTQTTIYMKDGKKNVVPEFVYYWLRTYRDSLFGFDQTAIPQLTVSQVSSGKIAIPSVDEQSRIAAILSTLDSLISSTSSLVSKYRFLREGMIEELLSKGIGEHKYQDSGIDWIGRIPAEWEVKTLGTLFKIGMGQTILSPSLIPDGKIPVYSATEKDIIFGYVNESTLELHRGDLVIPARGNSIGSSKIIQEDIATTTQTTIYMKTANTQLIPLFTYYWLRYQRDNLFGFDQTAIPQLTVSQVSTCPIVIPSKHEQEEIVQACSSIDIQINTEVVYLSKLKLLKQALMDDLLTGRVSTDKIDLDELTGR